MQNKNKYILGVEELISMKAPGQDQEKFHEECGTWTWPLMELGISTVEVEVEHSKCGGHVQRQGSQKDTFFGRRGMGWS